MNGEDSGMKQDEGSALVQSKGRIEMTRYGMQLRTMDEAWRFSNAVVRSGMAPRGMEKPEACLIALQLGAEIGLPPMASIQSIAVINGRPGIYGDSALGVVRASGLLEEYKQEWVGEGDSRKAVVRCKRRDQDAIVSEFSVADAKRADLWGKAGPWKQYPDRMLMFRARGFALRDGFGDVLKGLRTTEELQDMPRERDITSEVGVGHSRMQDAARDLAAERGVDLSDLPGTATVAEINARIQAAAKKGQQAATGQTAPAEGKDTARAPQTESGASSTPEPAEEPKTAPKATKKRTNDDVAAAAALKVRADLVAACDELVKRMPADLLADVQRLCKIGVTDSLPNLGEARLTVYKTAMEDALAKLNAELAEMEAK